MSFLYNMIPLQAFQYRIEVQACDTRKFIWALETDL